MPELPEVETVKRGLEKLILGLSVQNVNFDWPKSFPNSKNDINSFLIGSKVKKIRRRAKVLMIDLDSNYSLVIHLKMTGQLVFVKNQQVPNDKSQRTNNTQVLNGQSSVPTTLGRHSREGGDLVQIKSDVIPAKAGISKKLDSRSEPGMTVIENSADTRFGAGHPSDSLIGRLPDRSTRVEFTLDNDAKLFFNDQRKFGWVRLMPTVEIPNIDFMKKVGPEPLEAAFTFTVFQKQLQKRQNSVIKAALLDQTVIAGIGNIYADESLWGAKIHPSTRVKDVPENKLKKLFTEIRFVLQLSIEKGGSTDRNYVNAEGKRGSYIDFARVFRKEGTPCQRCGAEIVKSRVAGRGTHICSNCQKV